MSKIVVTYSVLEKNIDMFRADYEFAISNFVVLLDNFDNGREVF